VDNAVQGKVTFTNKREVASSRGGAQGKREEDGNEG